MTLGFVMMCHTALDRAAQVARHLADAGCPVMIHVDRRVSQAKFDALVGAVADRDIIRFCNRHVCEWGTWSLVEASQTGAEAMLDAFPDVGHVYLMSGSCLPLRPIAEFQAYLGDREGVDFIESVTTRDVPWTIGGLDFERFTLRFPFSWKRHRRLFDGYVEAQRRLKIRRRIPDGLVPHMGSQWWCLSRATLQAIRSDPRRAEFDRYFARVWIPDESYYQTLARYHGSRVESRSLTLSKFDWQGKPYIFYDDHLQLLRRSDCFMARKIWEGADRLYATFLGPADEFASRAEPNPGKIDRIFAKATERRTSGRAGLYMQSRFPRDGHEKGLTCAGYNVLEGFGDLFVDFPGWLARVTGARAHGHLFAPDRVQFADRQTVYAGALSDSAALRDYNPRAFLTNLIWNTRGERQCFLFGPRDDQTIAWDMAKDANARISVVTGAWAVPLLRASGDFEEIRHEAARLQQIESAHLSILRSHYARARIHIWSMADFVDASAEPLQTVLDGFGPLDPERAAELPQMVDLTGFGSFLQRLKNQGMQPHLMGDFPAGDTAGPVAPRPRKPYAPR